ncbi:MAG: hypothetical protein KJ949_00425, partial [Nanoarchaeota archaeon]|nr:hypothetical protein [Nanoarchaeota archaeon]
MTDLDYVKEKFKQYYELINSPIQKGGNRERALSNLEVELEGITLTGKEILEIDLGNMGESSKYKFLEKELEELRKRNITLEIKYDKLQKETKSCLNKSK